MARPPLQESTPREAEEVGRFSLGRRAFNADEADCCACEGTCGDLPQGRDLPICRALPLGEVRDRG